MRRIARTLVRPFLKIISNYNTGIVISSEALGRMEIYLRFILGKRPPSLQLSLWFEIIAKSRVRMNSVGRLTPVKDYLN